MVKETGLVSFQLETVLCTTDDRFLRTCKLLPCQQFPVNKIILIIPFSFLFFNLPSSSDYLRIFLQLIPLLSIVLLTRSHFFDIQKCQPKVWLHFIQLIMLYPIKLSIFSERGDLSFPSCLPCRPPNQSKRKKIQICIYSHKHAHRDKFTEQVHTDRRYGMNKRLGMNIVRPEKAEEGNMISYGLLI